MLQHFLQKIDEYIQVPSVVTCEKPFVDYLEKDFRALGANINRRGTTLGVHRGDGAYVLSAHIDRHGLIAQGDGLFAYAAGEFKQDHVYKEWTERRKSLESIAERYVGKAVYAYNAHSGKKIASGKVESSNFCEIRQNITFTIPQLEAIETNTPVAYTHDCTQQEGNYDGQIDNVVSAALIHTLYAHGYEGHALFTPQEEIGRSWQYLYAYLNQFDLKKKKLLVLDTSPFQGESCVSAGNVVLRYRDAQSTFDASFTDYLADVCAQLDVPCLFRDKQILQENEELSSLNQDVRGLGNTELGHLLVKADNTLCATTLQIPTCNYHESNETTSYLALQNALRVLEKITK